MQESEPEFKLRKFALPFYIPAFIGATGSGFLLPIIPLHIRAMGATYGFLGIILTMSALGAMVGNFLSVPMVGRFGKKRTMVLTLILEIAVGILASRISSPVLFMPILFIRGLAHSLFFIIRLAYFRELVPEKYRGRALSLLGGEARMGTSLGPAIGGLAAGAFGSPFVFLLYSLFYFFVLLMVIFSIPGDIPQARVIKTSTNLSKIFTMLKEHKKIFLSAGLGIVALTFVREGRNVLFPLWGNSIGMGVEQIGFLFTFSYIIEMVLFYPAGWLMDKKGRKYTAVPCLGLLSLGFFLLPLAITPVLFLLVVALMAVGNGLGSGINMTLSTDYAPQGKVMEFLATWRILTDTGSIVSPAVIGFIATVSGLAWSSPIIGIISLGGMVIMISLPQKKNG